MPPCRSLRPEEVLTKGEGNLEWITEVEDDECQLWSQDQSQW